MAYRGVFTVLSLLSLMLTIFLAFYGAPLATVQRWLPLKTTVLTLLAVFVGLHLFVLP